MIGSPNLAEAISCLSDYDPDALPVASVREIIERVVTPVEAIERVAIRTALGRVLAEDLISPIDVPSSDNSAMDGYAVRADDLAATGPTALRVAGTALAGQPFAESAGHGEAVRVMTGALMPEGFDTVVIQESVVVEGDRVIVPAGQQRGQNRRRRGEPASGSRRRTSACSHRSVSSRCRCAGACAWPSSPPVTSFARWASRSAPARSTTATATRSTAC